MGMSELRLMKRPLPGEERAPGAVLAWPELGLAPLLAGEPRGPASPPEPERASSTPWSNLADDGNGEPIPVPMPSPGNTAPSASLQGPLLPDRVGPHEGGLCRGLSRLETKARLFWLKDAVDSALWIFPGLKFRP